MSNNIAIITARGGSKRIPGKNIRSFLGKPIIQYSIEAALQSGLFNEVMVSTDSEEIAAISREAGAVTPFIRSAENSNDFATTADVLLEVLTAYEKKQEAAFEFGCCLYPTAPFITAEKLRQAYDRIRESMADTVFPVCEYSSSIWRAYRMKDKKLSHLWPEHANKRSQDLEPAYYDCGQFYFFNVGRFMQTRSLITSHSVGIEVPETEVQDIDTEKDWQLAELKYLYTFQPNRIVSLLK